MHLPWTSVKARQRFEFMPLRIDDNLTIPLFAVVTPCSSEPSFTGWRDGPVTPPAGVSPVARARTWLASVGWRRHGLPAHDKCPRSAPRHP
ncbi:MAG: hypothetical protein E6J56_23265 [Deltaproteobacteria bacterium]|nr:MAG: hypothetical protein E6J56_23265 [Deltaproteobacteria bacterium]